VLEDATAKQAVADLQAQWDGLAALNEQYKAYLAGKYAGTDAIATRNTAQHLLRAAFTPFFTALHADLKTLDKTLRHHEKLQSDAAQAEGKRGSTDRKTKALKTALEALHAEIKSGESWFAHIQWLQERFPEAVYDDVTGLCKLATRAEVKEQDWSLNPGRYVGVVIEEDGKTEEEFISGLLAMNDELTRLNDDAHKLECTISKNINLVVAAK